MSHRIEHSIKSKLRSLAKEHNRTFADLWQNLILERFLARVYGSDYRDYFTFKGGALLARYIPLGRETKDLNFLIEGLPNMVGPLRKIIDEVCLTDLEDGFTFETVKIEPLSHPHMKYSGLQVALLVRLGGTKTRLDIDIGFGDVVDAVEHFIDLMATRKGPLFEGRIQVRCYPREFIFAEKLETVVFRGEANSRMKDFHDLYSLVTLPESLDPHYTEEVVVSVFRHRGTSLSSLPLPEKSYAQRRLADLWGAYLKDQTVGHSPIDLPDSLQQLISTVNQWLRTNTNLLAPLAARSEDPL